MINKQAIVHWAVVLLLFAGVVALGITASRRVADPICSSVTILIKDSTERQYVTSGELRQQLAEAGLWQTGTPLSKISTAQIEKDILSHPMIRRAECYEQANGVIRILAWQRIPVVLIAGDEHYYLDSDRKQMPVRASVNTPVITVSGRIGRQQAQGEMYDFVQWLAANRFWRERIHTIHVVTPKMIELIDSSHDYTIILGTLDGAEQRLTDLQKLYDKGFETRGYPDYKQIDLQYSNQIIGRK